MEMKQGFIKLLFVPLLFCQFSAAQNTDNAAVLQLILERYYKTEKPVYKGRSQLLYLYCNQANNNEEIFEAIHDRKLPDDFLREMRKTIASDTADRDWSTELAWVFANDKSNLKQKIGECLSLDKYHEVSRRLNLNNQRLMIISKPLYYSKSNIALVKVVFYRNIEHNNGAILMLEKTDGVWTIKEYLNSWAT